MNSLKHFFSKPHPFNYKGNAAWISGLIIAFLLFALQPFGFSQLDTFARLWKSVLLGAVTTFTLLLSYGIVTRISPGTFARQQWYVWKDLLFSAFNMVLIGVANSLVIFWLNMSPEALWPLIVQVVPNTFYIGFVASVLLLFLEQSLYLATEMRALEKINEQLASNREKDQAGCEIVFKSESGVPEFKLSSQDIVYLKSGGNYVDIIWEDETHVVHKELLRNRLKVVSEWLSPDAFFACHRSHIINLKRIRKIKRGDRDYELILRGTEDIIPVSRAKAPQLMALLTADKAGTDNS